ncbi:YkgJ family cysteine cluster protein [Thermococcus sp.]
MERTLVAVIHLDTMEIEARSSFKFKCVKNCGKCCMELDIPLRDEDIAAIEDLGYSAWEFVDYEKMFYRGDRFLGYALKKRPFDDACIFLDENSRCRIYPHRPRACRLYPFVLIRNGSVMEVYIRNDEFCPGINHPEGETIDQEFIREYFSEIIEEYGRKLKSSGI